MWREPSGLSPVGTAGPALVRSKKPSTDPTVSPHRPANASLFPVGESLSSGGWLRRKDRRRRRSNRSSTVVCIPTELHERGSSWLPNHRDQWFQDALVEDPWSKPPSLVPEDWPDLNETTN